MSPEESLALLERFEPVIRYTRGELFLPMSVEDYVDGSALVQGAGASRTVRVERGELTIGRLCELARSEPAARLALERVGEPLDRAALRAWRRRPDREDFHPSSRFAVVGLLSRLVDSIMRLTLLLRGRVPGGFAAAAQQAYAASGSADRCVYYGHVSRDGGYIACQYWFFYAMNDWRSTFGGVNDHEGDWEQVTVFVAEADLCPAWVAYSAHDEVGDDLRRRWDDPDLSKIGDHPVVFAGAGSHSGAYLPGEYVISTPIPLPGWLGGLRSAWAKVRPWAREEDASVLSIPYLDYHRGDGVTVGVGGDRPWHPVLIDDRTPWVRDFRGLWGLDTNDPLGGERAPAGPRYERRGTVRESWGEPVAWAGLDKEAASAQEAVESMQASQERLTGLLAQVETELDAARRRLRGARAAERGLGRNPRRPTQEQSALRTEVAGLRSRRRELIALIEGVDSGIAGQALTDGVHAHLTHRAVPLEAETLPTGRVLRFWTAASATILLAALGILLIIDGASQAAVLVVAGAMLIVEAVLRRRLVALVCGLIVIGIGLVGIWAVFSFFVGNVAGALGVALLFAAGYLGFVTVREGFATR